MTQAVITKESDGTLASLLRQPNYANRFKEVLGERAGQFVSSVLSVGSTMKDVEPTSIISSAMIAASLDLPINKNLGFAWIVPYMDKGRKVAQFQMGYKGFIQLALRTGHYSRMNVRGVNSEAFGGYDDIGEPIIHWNLIDEAKETVGYVFAFQLVNGFTKICYWRKAEVEAHAQRYSQSYRGKFESPWKTHFDAMAKKTVVKNELSRWGLLSIQFHEALNADQAVEMNDGLEYVDNPPPEPMKKPPLERKHEETPTPQQQGTETNQARVTPPPPEKAGETDASNTQSAVAEVEPHPYPVDPYVALAHILETNGVSFDGFKSWLKETGRDRQGGFASDVLTDIKQIPYPFAVALAADTKAMAKCVRLYGKTTP